MKTMLKLLVTAAISLPATVFAAADVNTFNSKGASAFFSITDSSECISTSVYVTASDTAGLLSGSPPAPGEAGSTMTAWIYQNDACYGTTLLDVFASNVPLAREDFEVTGNLTSANLNTSVNAYDWVSGTYIDFILNLIWTRTGPLEGANTGFVFRYPRCHMISRYRGSGGAAAASGTVEHGTTNYTPAPALFSGIDSQLTGEIMSNCE